MEFKDAGKRKTKRNPEGNADTLYFNAYTEDLFTWENDLEGDSDRHFQLNEESKFFEALKDLALDETIAVYLTLTNEWDIMRELNPAKKPEFDAIVANPPFSYRWEPTDAMGDDVRFKNHGLAPKSAADFAFLLHGFHSLKQEGVMAIILPHGVLFRGGAEERIRT
jgi:hypothetical protein